MWIEEILTISGQVDSMVTGQKILCPHPNYMLLFYIFYMWTGGQVYIESIYKNKEKTIVQNSWGVPVHPPKNSISPYNNKHLRVDGGGTVYVSTCSQM